MLRSTEDSTPPIEPEQVDPQMRRTLALYLGLAISLAVLGFNLFGDGLRDALDPRSVEAR